MRPDTTRTPVAGTDSGPEPPFPLRLNGKVVKGFGRGSADLGIPTANIPIAGLSVGGHEDVQSGVYFGWAGLDVDEEGRRIPISPEALQNVKSESNITENTSTTQDAEASGPGKIYPMVLSIGYNPFYKNTVRSVEVHILHRFPVSFYGAHMNLLILGFIRPEYDYVSKEALIADIEEDIAVTRRSLAREGWDRWKGDSYLRRFPQEGKEGGGVGAEGVGDVGS